MDVYNERTIASLRAGKITASVGHGRSMEPVIYSGQTQFLVPILAENEARGLGCTRFDPDETWAVGDRRYLTPEDVREKDAVYCKVRSIFTHEVAAIRQNGGTLEFLIARHDRRKINGWTTTIYGLCVKTGPLPKKR